MLRARFRRHKVIIETDDVLFCHWHSLREEAKSHIGFMITLIELICQFANYTDEFVWFAFLHLYTLEYVLAHSLTFSLTLFLSLLIRP